MTICVSWDSGPYGIYTEYTGIDCGQVVDVPDEVFKRYELAREELLNAEAALDKAIDATK